MLSELGQKKNRDQERKVCDPAAALIETFEAFEQPADLVATPLRHESGGAKEKGQERKNAGTKRKRKRRERRNTEIEWVGRLVGLSVG